MNVSGFSDFEYTWQQVGVQMILRRALAVWLIIMFAEFIHGLLRTAFLVPYVGDFQSRQIGVFSGSLLILIIACLTVRWISADTIQSLTLVGFFWLSLTLVFELGFGRFVFRLSWQRLASDYDIVRGGLLPFGLIFLTLSPLISARLRDLKMRDHKKFDAPPESNAAPSRENEKIERRLLL
jgi:hypothetical protein